MNVELAGTIVAKPDHAKIPSDLSLVNAVQDTVQENRQRVKVSDRKSRRSIKYTKKKNQWIIQLLSARFFSQHLSDLKKAIILKITGINELHCLLKIILFEFGVIGRNAATRVHSNLGSSTDQFDWEGRKIKGNRKKTPRKCPFQGRNLKVSTPEEGRGKEKVETFSVAVPSEVGILGVQ